MNTCQALSQGLQHHHSKPMREKGRRRRRREGKKEKKREERRSHFLTPWMKASVCKEAALFQWHGYSHKLFSMTFWSNSRLLGKLRKEANPWANLAPRLRPVVPFPSSGMKHQWSECLPCMVCKFLSEPRRLPAPSRKEVQENRRARTLRFSCTSFNYFLTQ